ncbi:ParB family protein [Pseudomonas sp. B21-054]|uniref:ParB family protein n=1 Tax=Pseudomonas sp. B21-054 TaxID=2895494 RepID=UPI00222E14DA|nr:ParB family protein [Pseudomonas sp. B21-054]UZE16036.1 ParB family protein [Pseudomonas sp. B21-054]
MSVASTYPTQDEASKQNSKAPCERAASGCPSDPEVETPLIVTLDCLKPYDLDPRVTRNPKYDEIKASIRQRGLDAPPPITRRPGEPYFRVRNGGNTRLSILRELWSETKDEQYFHLTCMFRPWPERGEIISLTGHLAENEMRGGLTFIERALGVEKARELYELESGTSLSQSELSRRLTADGYPVHQSHISRMRDAVHYLLPAIPNVLYGGLGRHQVERLAVLRRTCVKIWEEHAKTKILTIDFASLFQEALMLFDGTTADFSIDRAQDEVIGQMAHYLGVDYDTLALASEAGEKREQALTHVPMKASLPCPRTAAALDTGLDRPAVPSILADSAAKIVQAVKEPNLPEVSDSDRLQSIQALVARHAGDGPSLASDVLPFAQGSLFPISDIWNIDPALDEPQRLRIHISQFAREICQDVAKADVITEVDEGIGFRCCFETVPEHPSPLTLVALLETLTTNSSASSVPMEIGALLLGTTQPDAQACRLSDANLIKLFRLIRLARRLIDLKSEFGTDQDMHTKEEL